MSEVVKYGDKLPVTVTASVDLTGSTYRVLMRNVRTPAGAPVELTTTAVNLALGKVKFITSGTLPVGDYYVELEASWPDGTVMTFPGGNPDDGAPFALLRVIPDLDLP